MIHAEFAVSRSHGASVVDVEPWFCVDGRCPIIIDKRVAYADYGHISAQFAADLEPLVAASFQAAALR